MERCRKWYFPCGLNLCRSWRGIPTDIDFTVKKGETVGIIGGTGSGKSSVVNLIPRFYDATKGSVQIGGKDVREYSLEELRGKIGMVLQKAVLFKGTIRENMLWGNEMQQMRTSCRR